MKISKEPYPEPAFNSYKKCKLCSHMTRYVMNIDFKAVPICNSCANAIMLQQAKWLIEQNK